VNLEAARPSKGKEKVTMSSLLAQYAAVREIVGSTDVAIIDTAASANLLAGFILPVWYREGCRAPEPGERLGTWIDVSTRYVMAPRG
jgi:hypothetical protein